MTAIPRLARLIRAEDPDLILSWGVKPQAYSALAALLAGRKDAVVWRQTELPSHVLHRLVTMLPTRVIFCPSRFVARAQRRVWPYRSTVVWYPGTEPSRAPAIADVEEIRARHGIDPSRTVIGTIGRLVPVKRHDVFIRAIARLRAERHDVIGLLVGGDLHGFAPGHEQDLRQLAQELDCADSIIFTGQVSHARDYLRLMTVFVTAATDEAFGNSVVEAMAAGVPIVVTPRGGPSEFVEQGRSGLIAGDSKPSQIAAAVSCLLEDDGLRGALAHGAARHYRQRFTAERSAADLTRKLADLVKR